MSSSSANDITRYGKGYRSSNRANNDRNINRRNYRRKMIKKTVRKQRDLKQYFFVIRELTKREIKRKYARSFLGILWSVLSPLLFMIVMSLVFSTMFKRSIENFPVYYMIGHIIWELFSVSTRTSMTSFVDNKNLLLKSKLPKQTFILSRLYTSFVNFLFNCIAFVSILLVFQITPTWKMLLFPLPILLCLVFCLGVSYILSTIYVFFGDIKHLYSVLLTMLMYLCAIFYPVDRLPDVMQSVVGNNPVYLFIHCSRDCILNGVVSHWSVWLKMVIWAVGMFVLGIIVYKRKENDIMQRI